MDVDKILERADRLVVQQDQWAAMPSADLQVRAAIQATCEAVAAVIRPVLAELVTIVTSSDNAEKNVAIARIQALLT